MELREITDVLDEYTGRRRAVLEYGLTVQRIVEGSKGPGFTSADWEPLAGFVDPVAFERVGPFKEVQNWPAYVEFLTAWAPAAEWEGRFKRVTDHDGLVFLELEEWTRMGELENVVNSLSVYEFDDTDRIVHLDVYLQLDLTGMLGGA